MSSLLVGSRPVPGNCRNPCRHLRRNDGGDILAGVPGPYALQICWVNDRNPKRARDDIEAALKTLKNLVSPRAARFGIGQQPVLGSGFEV